MGTKPVEMQENEKVANELRPKLEAVDSFHEDVTKAIKAPDGRFAFNSDDLVLYRVEEITFEEDSPRLEALENVFSCMARPGINFVYLIRGGKSGVKFYFGFMRDYAWVGKDKKVDSIAELGRAFLKPALEGNFRGSTIKEVDKRDSAEIQKDLKVCLENKDRCLVMTGVPGDVQDKEQQDFRGIDRLVDIMQGDDFGFMIIACALDMEAIEEIRKSVFHVYETFAPMAKIQTQRGGGIGASAGSDKHRDHTEQTGEGIGGGEHKDSSTADGKNGQHWNHSSTRGRGWNTSWHKDKGESDTTGTGEHRSYSANSDWHVSTELTNKSAEDWVKYFDDVLIPRLDYGRGKGVFLVSSLMFGGTHEVVEKLAGAAKSIFSGGKANRVPLCTRCAGPNERKFIGSLQLTSYSPTKELQERAEVLIPYCEALLCEYPGAIGNWMTSRELALMAGLPQKEVIGLRLKEEVEFGLNVPVPEPEKRKAGNSTKEVDGEIDLGKLVKSGIVCDSVPITLRRDQLDRHIFVSGVTGCGKTTTCQNLLLGSKWNFLVIEPAKTEYRGLMGKECPDLLVFTLGNDKVAPFRLNPFELIEGESITSRVDMLMASISAAFDMEAAIPQLIERAIYACYEDCGWSVRDDTNRFHTDPFEDGVFAFPTLSDVLAKTEHVVNEQGFDERLKRDYIGSIRARLQGLTLGSKGMMLDCKRSVDFEKLLDRKVVLELEDIPNAQQKSLIIGFILTNLMQVIKRRYENNGGRKICHITLIEEAHRLLTKPDAGTSPSRRQATEMFSDMLAEVRKYGEALIIADQIPGKLIPEVIKNTNTKIIHRLFAQDDKEAVGFSMGLKDEQIEFLSNLQIGHAVVFNGSWQAKPVQAKINERHQTDSAITMTEKSIHDAAMSFYGENRKRGELSEFSGIALDSNGLEWVLGHDRQLKAELDVLRGKGNLLECLDRACSKFGKKTVLQAVVQRNWGEQYQKDVVALLEKVLGGHPDIMDVLRLRNSFPKSGK